MLEGKYIRTNRCAGPLQILIPLQGFSEPLFIMLALLDKRLKVGTITILLSISEGSRCVLSPSFYCCSIETWLL